MIIIYYNTHNRFKKQIVLVTFLAYITLCVFAEFARDDGLSEDFPGAFRQEVDLAESVCYELDVIPVKTCSKKFLEHRGSFSEYPPELQIMCRSEAAVTFLTNTTNSSQLIFLVNEEEVDDIINYKLVNESDIKGEGIISTIFGSIKKNYTFWTGLLDREGRHSVWKKGPVIQPWEEMSKHLERRKYDVKMEFLFNNYKEGTHVIEASFTWNNSDISDSCFLVHNTCNKKTQGDFFEKRIKPQDGQSVVVDGLPLDDRCTFLVTGKHGNSSLTYDTPACHLLRGCFPLPETVKDLDINAIEDDEDDLWVVEVEWSKPRYNHTFYNVTLRADHTQSAVIPGNSTRVTFRNVTGEGFYNVTVASVINDAKVVTSKLALFPARTHGSEGWLIGAAWFAALLAAVGAASLSAALLAWRKRRHDKHRGHNYADIHADKLMMFSDADMGQELIPEGSDQWEVRPERLQLYEVIGEGAFGVVRRGTLLPEGRDVAVKMLKDFPTLEEVRSFRSEAELMKSVGAHPHVVSLLGCCSGRRPLLVAEYCSRGDLLTYLRCAWDVMVSKRNVKYCNNNKHNVDYRNDLFRSNDLKEDAAMVVNRLYDIQGVCDTELTFLDLLSFCRQIAMGMEFLAANRVIHRDLAARNVLVTADRTLKIADFGLSRDVYQENQYRQKGNGKMPVKWMALESLTHRIYTSQSDVWSFGVVMWEVVTLGGAPYASLDGARLPRLLRAGYRMPRPRNCSPQLYEVMLSCWHERPRSRPTFSELHERLDALLAASAHPYLPLQLHAPPAPPAAHAALYATHRYVRMVLGARVWGRGRSYERPNCASTKRNHYIDRPTTLH